MSRLHEEGAPGTREMYLRQQLGDAAYEEAVDNEKAMQAVTYLRAAAELDHTRARTQLVRTVVALLGLLVGCALGAVVVLAVWATL